jgi:alanine-alpha-ketoisovalerate/valine-pyruvate aminotransferase
MSILDFVNSDITYKYIGNDNTIHCEVLSDVGLPSKCESNSCRECKIAQTFTKYRIGRPL